MKLAHRRQFLHFTASVAALPAFSHFAWAQAYPSRLIRLIVAFPAGGGVDILARLLGQWLSERLGQPFIVENRPGASGNIGAETVARASADGYTLLLINSSNAINATLYDKLNFNFIADIAPVAGISAGPSVLVINPSFPAKTVPELIAYAKANPDKVNFASSGNGSNIHLAGELFKTMAGVKMIHVPYRGTASAVSNLIGGQVQVMFASIPVSIEYIKDGKLRALAVTTAARSEALPNVPTVGEFVPGFEAIAVNGIGAPKNTPIEIVDKLNKAINAALADPKMKARLADLGGAVLPGTPADFGKLLAEETEKWGKVIRAANIKPI